MDEELLRIIDLFDNDEVTTADKIDRPENPYRDFEERNPRADGGTIAGGNIQGQQIGDRTGFAKPVFLPSKNEYVVKGRDNNVVKRFKISDYKNKQEAKKETFKFYKDFTEKNREKAKIKSMENRAKINKARTDYKISIKKLEAFKYSLIILTCLQNYFKRVFSWPCLTLAKNGMPEMFLCPPIK